MFTTVSLGRTTVAVTRLGFGAAVIGGLFAAVSDEQAQAALQEAWDQGIRYFDTSPHYGAGLSEIRLGTFLRDKPRDSFTISTKVGRRLEPWTGPEALETHGFVDALPNTRILDFSRDGVLHQIDTSLDRLGLDHIDILYVHDPDDHADDALQGAIPTLVELRDQGVIGAAGIGTNQWQLPARFVRESDIDVVMLAGRFTLLDQSASKEFLPLCLSRQVAVVAAGVFNSGVLTNPRPGAHYDYETASDEIVERARSMQQLCSEFGVPLAVVAAQFPLLHPAVTSVVLGMRDARQAASSSSLMSTPIPNELWSALEDIGVDLPADES